MDRFYSPDYYLARTRLPAWRIEAAVVRRLAGPALRGTVLDVGCGCGTLLSVLQPACGIGIDHCPDAIELARKLHPQYQFHLDDALNLPSSLDGIVHTHLIEHLADPAAAIRAWHAALKPGGRIVLTTPNRDFAHPECYADPDHKHIFSGPELADLFSTAGFSILRLFTLGCWGVRHWPFFWRFQPFCARLCWPALPGLRWRGQSLCLAAVKGGPP